MKSINAFIGKEPASRQLEILAYVARCGIERLVPPTLREIGKRFNIRSTNGVNDHLRSLIRRGLLEKGRRMSRCLRVTKSGVEKLRREGYAVDGATWLAQS